MMRAIWKYRIPEQLWRFPLDMPVGAVFRSVSPDGPGYWSLYFEVDPRSEARYEERMFRRVATGEAWEPIVGKEMVYLDTFSHNGFVWHMFEVRSR